MVRAVTEFSRTGVEDRQAIVRCYLPVAAAHNLLMRIYAAAGNTTLLVQQYNELSRLLQYELGGKPSAETRAAFAA